MASYMKIDTLNRLTGEGAVVSGGDNVRRAFGVAGTVAAVEGFAGHRVRSMKAYTLASFLEQDRRARVRHRGHSYRALQ